MNEANSDELIRELENYVECWKQFSLYLQLAASQKFLPEDEMHFLELKSVLAQELELLLPKLGDYSVNRAEMHELISNVPSLAFLADARDDTIRTTENRWHKIYIAWQSVLGQLKVNQRKRPPRPGSGSWFRSK